MVRKGEKMSIFNSTTSKRVSILSFDNVKQSYLLATGFSIVFSRSDGELSHGMHSFSANQTRVICSRVLLV